MRKRVENKDISVNAIAGTEVVLLGINATEKAAAGLLGFTIYKRVGTAKKEEILGKGKIFEGVHDLAQKQEVNSDQAPIQAFMWSDYEAHPGKEYTYRVVPVYGKPGALKPGKGVEVTIKPENPDDGTHAIYFNRGVAGSYAYSKSFGQNQRFYKVSQGFGGRQTWTRFIKPEDVPDRAAFTWLSRGLEEGMLKFIGQAKGSRYSIRASLYELTHKPVIQAFVNALEGGADVKIIHHYKQVNSFQFTSSRDGASVTVTYPDGGKAPVTFKKKDLVKKQSPDSVGRAADQATGSIGINSLDHQKAYDEMYIKRTNTTISHNKFIILLKDGKPEQVWTGSTNITGGGIYGQSNVGHAVRDPAVAQKYFEYWEKLSTDPTKKEISKWIDENQPDFKGDPPESSITPIFSPRPSTNMLSWYSDRLAKANSSAHFTAAFTVSNQIFDKVTKTKKVAADQPYLRYLLLEGIGGLIKPKYPAMKKVAQNRIAYGDVFAARKDEPIIESLTGLNDHVNYLHTKYMLIDPLTDDPIVITGSANFSDASTVSNDENMLVIRGDTRVADIFLGEFMRLFNHFRFRNRSNELLKAGGVVSDFLIPDDSWTKPYYAAGSQECNERLLFK